MATTVSSPWGKPGAWALEAEQEAEQEAKLQQQQEKQQNSDVSAEPAEYPSLAAAVKQPKKKKNQSLSLAEFTNYRSGSSKPSQQQPKGLTHEDLLNLPTGPRDRTPEELDRSRGFKSYGLNNNNNSREDSSNSRWSSGGGGGSSSRAYNRDASRESQPSRADEIDDWSKAKKSTVGNGYERREKERGFFFESQSKADESESWIPNKPPPATEARRFGATFERRGGSFDSLSRERHVYNSSNNNNKNNNNNSDADSDNWGRKKEESTGRPKLVLQPRTLPVSDGNGGTVAKPKGSSPFGEARPREEVLAEKGKDWKEIDEKLESGKISGYKDTEKGERGESGAFGSGRRGGFGRTWRKPEAVDSGLSGHQRAEKTENGLTNENGIAENDIAEGN